MALYVVVHHQGDKSQPWQNAWLNDELIDTILTTSEIGHLCQRAKERGERVFVHRCGWGEFLPVVCCSAEVGEVGRIDKTTALVRFRSATAVGTEPSVRPEKGQNFYQV